MKKLLFPLFMILMIVIMRLLPHLPNFTPVAGLALFSGAYLNKKWALFIPLVGMFIADYFIGFHNTIAYVYGAFLVTSLLGIWLSKHKNLNNVIYATLASSILFFLITNFGVWMQGYYGNSLSGLWQSYVMGIPFFRMTLAGDLFYTGVFFGSYSLATTHLTSIYRRYII